MKLANVWVIYRKEFLDVLRDRRTLMSMILLPIIIFPLLMAGLGGFLQGQMEKLKQRSSPIVVLGSKWAPELIAALKEKPGLQVITTIEDSSLALEMLQDQTIKAVVSIPHHFSLSLDEGMATQPADSIQIWYDGSQQESELVERKVRQRFQEFREALVQKELKARGLSPKLMRPFDILSSNRASPSQMTGVVLGMLLPYMVILLTIVGSTYSAIDLTAGEKERGTMETLLVSPATRLELVLGKFFTTMTVGTITAVLAVISLSATVLAPGSVFRAEMGQGAQFSLDTAAFGMAFLLLIPVAAFFAAILIAIAINARSYKEAQSYVYPVIILAVFPAIVSMLPGIETNAGMALIPVINVSLVLRDAFLGNYDPGLIILTFISSIVYAAGAIFVAVRIFQKESVLLRT